MLFQSGSVGSGHSRCREGLICRSAQPLGAGAPRAPAGSRHVIWASLPSRPTCYFVQVALGEADTVEFAIDPRSTALLDRRRRRLGDLLADTLVVEERGGRYLAFAAAGERRFNSLRTPRMRRLIAHRLGAEDREFLLAVCLRANAMAEGARHDLFEASGAHFRAVLEIDDDRLTGEAVVRGLASVCHGRDTD